MIFAEWLALREPADAAARSAELAARLRLPPAATIHDLGSGTGSMHRWLAPLLPGHPWVLHDRDASLLPSGVDTRVGDVTRLSPVDLAGAGLVTASALLDMLTGAELDRVVAACAGIPVLFALTVTGGARLDPPDPLDAAVAAAFDDHQRRDGRLGPDAVDAAVAAFARHGFRVTARPTPWRLGPPDTALATEWFRGWLGAAREQRPDLPTDAYERRRLGELAAGRLAVVVPHADLLAEPLAAGARTFST